MATSNRSCRPGLRLLPPRRGMPMSGFLESPLEVPQPDLEDEAPPQEPRVIPRAANVVPEARFQPRHHEKAADARIGRKNAILVVLPQLVAQPGADRHSESPLEAVKDLAGEQVVESFFQQ